MQAAADACMARRAGILGSLDSRSMRCCSKRLLDASLLLYIQTVCQHRAGVMARCCLVVQQVVSGVCASTCCTLCHLKSTAAPDARTKWEGTLCWAGVKTQMVYNCCASWKIQSLQHAADKPISTLHNSHDKCGA